MRAEIDSSAALRTVCFGYWIAEITGGVLSTVNVNVYGTAFAFPSVSEAWKYAVCSPALSGTVILQRNSPVVSL